MGPRSKRKRKLDTTSSNSKKVINDKDTVRLEPVKKARTKKTRGAVGEEEDSFSEYEQQEDFVDMADISGFSRFSIDSADSIQDGNELETSGVTDTEVLNSSKEKEDLMNEDDDEMEKVSTFDHSKSTRMVEKRVRMPSWRGREDEKRAVRPKGRVRTAHMEKITGKQHPMVYSNLTQPPSGGKTAGEVEEVSLVISHIKTSYTIWTLTIARMLKAGVFGVKWAILIP